MTAKRHSDRLKRIAGQTAQRVAAKLYEAGQLIELDAERSITNGSISGKGHIVSAPGEAPNADTRNLDNNIETRIGGSGLVIVESHATYSAALEFGTSKLQARPFMGPAADRNRRRVTELVGDAVNTSIRRS